VVDQEEDIVEMAEVDIEVDHLQVVLDIVEMAEVDIEVDHLQVDQEDMMDVLVKVDQEVDMLHVEMRVVDIEVDHLQVVLDTVVVRVVVMEVTHSVAENLLEVDMLHVEMKVVLVLHVMEMHLIMLIHSEVNSTCIYTCIYYNLGTQYIEFPFLWQKNSSSNKQNKRSILQNDNLGFRKSSHFPLRFDIFSE
jgi:hypothetical protein